MMPMCGRFKCKICPSELRQLEGHNECISSRDFKGASWKVPWHTATQNCSHELISTLYNAEFFQLYGAFCGWKWKIRDCPFLVDESWWDTPRNCTLRTLHLNRKHDSVLAKLGKLLIFFLFFWPKLGLIQGHQKFQKFKPLNYFFYYFFYFFQWDRPQTCDDSASPSHISHDERKICVTHHNWIVVGHWSSKYRHKKQFTALSV